MIPDHPFRDYRGRRVTVLGLGAFGGGSGAVRFLAERGARVRVTDLRTAEQLRDTVDELRDVPVDCWRLGVQDESDVAEAELVVVNPAVPRSHPLLAVCQSRGIPLTSEMNLFWQHQRGRVLAVTGSNGKSTTTALLYSILKQTGRRCWLGGNLGKSLLPVVDQIEPGDDVVLELSSFQLTDLDHVQVSPHVGVVTNFAPNHLDWHRDLDDYRWAKQTLLRWQTASDFIVLNADDPDVSTWNGASQRLMFSRTTRQFSGAFLEGDDAVICVNGDPIRVPLKQHLRLPGRHNQENALAALAAAAAVGADLEAMARGLESYEPLPHRLQFVGEAAGRRFYNDSLATTPESAIVALEAFAEPVVLLAGGYDKGVDLTAFAAVIATRAKAVALMGTTGPRLGELIAANPQSRAAVSPRLTDFPAVFGWAIAQSTPGDVILLSPGCASYDWFRNFADRGEQFTQRVLAWIAGGALA